MKKKIIIAILFFSIIPSCSIAFDDRSTHPTLISIAVENTFMQSFLGNQLGVNKKIDTRYLQLGDDTHSIIDLLREGSTKEDNPMCRAANHFHNPLKPWAEAGLDSLFIGGGCSLFTSFDGKYSNLVWATGYESESVRLSTPVNNDSEVNEGRNWDVARNFYYTFLTAPSEIKRNTNLAELFKTLGYVIHLLQDMAVPAHTRNDFFWGHLKDIDCPAGGCEKEWYEFEWIGNPFEGYVRDNFKIIESEIETISLPFAGEKTLTNFWDTDFWKKIDPQSDAINVEKTTEFNIGLAEYSNANFVSASSIFQNLNEFPFPNRDSIADEDYPERIAQDIYDIIAQDGKLDKGIYIRKNKHGETIDKFLAPRYVVFDESGGVDGPEYAENVYKLLFKLDDQCHKEYAQKLIPRAIGYSAALIDYFFRGRIAVEQPYFVFDADGSIVGISGLQVQNVTSVDNGQTIEPFGPGTLELVYYYTPAEADMPIYNLVDTPAYEIADANDPINSGLKTIVTINFDENEHIPPGVAPEDITMLLVFKGKLGDEENGVAAQTFTGKVPSRIAYGYQPGGQPNTSNIFTISPDGSFPYQVTNALEPNPWYFSPTWSLDGTMMAFEKERCTDPNPNGPHCRADFLFRDIIGIDLLSEATYPDNQLFALNFNGDSVANPSFSPDGTMIAVLKRTESGWYYYGSLVVFDLVNTNQWIVNTDDDPNLTILSGSDPAWSPVGDKIAYYLNSQYDDVSRTMKFEGDLFLIDPYTGAKTRLTNDEFNNTQPSWSPDGEMIVFSSDRDGEASMDIWLMDRDGENLTRLVDCTPASCYSPTFSPDGRYVAFSNGSRIYTVSIDGDPYSIKEIAYPGQYISALTWSSFLVPPSFIDVQAEPGTIPAGGSSVLSWQTDRATEVLIQGIVEKQPANGTITVSPGLSTTYTLTAVGPTGATETTITVSVE